MVGLLYPGDEERRLSSRLQRHEGKDDRIRSRGFCHFIIPAQFTEGYCMAMKKDVESVTARGLRCSGTLILQLL